MPTRRAFLLGGSAAVAVGAAGVGVQQGALPGRPWVQAHLGLNGEAGVPPDAPPARVETGSFVSERRGGLETGWILVRPPDAPPHLPVVVALHGRGGNAAMLLGPSYELDRYLSAAVAAGLPPFAVAAADGGASYWHPRPSGEDAGGMVVDELLPMLAERGLDVSRIGLLGWSMGGYGALRLAALLGPERVGAVAACSPAIWNDPDDASRSGFADDAEYERFSVVGHQADLDGIPIRVDCGTGDPFYRATQDYVAALKEQRGPDDAAVISTFEPGGHDPAFWRRMLPAQLEFLGRRVGLDA